MKVKLDENSSSRLIKDLRVQGYEVDTVSDEGLTRGADVDVWRATQAEQRFPITQDMDFSDVRIFAPGTHAGLLLVRLREPGGNALLKAVSRVAVEIRTWAGCFVVLTDRKLRIRRP